MKEEAIVRVRCIGCAHKFDSPKHTVKLWGTGSVREEHRCPKCGAATPNDMVDTS